ncbi:MAG: beta-ketoacyl synthase chain length factor [Gammaproteobacteria bacterium]|nr:beta-ketoacyl synthase chain length factor [Gammaproteobacteria bacterium]
MLTAYLKSVGITAPGIKSWSEARTALQCPDQYILSPVDKKLETLLPANEHRRATRVTQLALSAAQQTGTQEELNQCLQIFSSCNGDLTTFNQISLALAMDGRPVSPTRFHNSVHNAPSGYWSIATQSQTASTSITAYTDSLTASLLEAIVQLNASDNKQHRDCLLVCYDEVPPQAFDSQFNATEEFACALTLSQNSNNALAKLEISVGDGSKALSTLSSDILEQLRLSNPQAIILPVLNVIANSEDKTNLYSETITLPYFEQGMNIIIRPLKHD